MADNMKILAFAASHRPTSLNRQLLDVAMVHVGQRSPDMSVTAQPFEFFDLPLFNDAWREQYGMPAHADVIAELLRDADMLLIAAPEYNWSMPAALKNMIDWMSCYRPVPLAGKTAFLMCATPSERGGMLGLSHLKTTLEGLGMLVYPTMFGLGKAHGYLQHGALVDIKKQQQLYDQLDGFMAYATMLKLN